MSQSTNQPWRHWLRPHLDDGPTRPWQAVAAQSALLAGALVFYYLVRAVSKGAEARAVANAYDLLSFERAFGLDWELSAQLLILDRPGWIAFFNWVYVWTYWPVLFGALTFLWVRHRLEFTILRDALVISGTAGLLIFAVYPVAPPRFLDGFTDTVTQSSREHFVAHPPGLINEFAALPSFHVGWQAVALVALAAFLPRRIRGLAFVPPALMTAAIVFTANHYVVDAIAGVALSLAGLGVARRIHAPQPVAAPGLPIHTTSSLDATPTQQPRGHVA